MHDPSLQHGHNKNLLQPVLQSSEDVETCIYYPKVISNKTIIIVHKHFDRKQLTPCSASEQT